MIVAEEEDNRSYFSSLPSLSLSVSHSQREFRQTQLMTSLLRFVILEGRLFLVVCYHSVNKSLLLRDICLIELGLTTLLGL